MAKKRELEYIINGVVNSNFYKMLKTAQGGFKNLSQTAKMTSRRTDRSALSFGRLTNAIALGNLAAKAYSKTISTLYRFGADSFNLASELEQTEMGFEIMLKSVDRAKRLMSEIHKFAADTPFEFPELASTSKQLLAFGFQADEVRSKLEMLGNISAGLNTPLEDLAAVYGKMRVQGRAFAYDIKSFTSRGIPIIQLLAKQFNITENSVMKMVSSGKVGFKEIDMALKAMTSEGGLFYKMMDKQATTFKGMLSTVTDMFNLIGAGILKNLMPPLKEFMQYLINNSGKIEAFGDRIIKSLAPVMNIGTFLKAGKASDSLTKIFTPLVNFITKSLFPLLKELGTDIAGIFVEAWPAIKPALDTLMNGLGKLLSSIMPVISHLWKALKPIVAFVIKTLAPAFITGLGVVFNAFGRVISAVTRLYGWLVKVYGYIKSFVSFMVKNPVFGMITRAVSGAKNVAGARAGGGYVASGRQYLVGERGPELFTPNVSGRIIPNNRLAAAGGITINLSVDARGASGADIQNGIKKGTDYLKSQLMRIQRDEIRRSYG